jgi:hypothetical protein
LSDFCRIADRKSLIDELNLVHDPSQRRCLQRLSFTTVLTAALSKGLELYLSSSSSSESSTNDSSPNTNSMPSESFQHPDRDINRQDSQQDQQDSTSALQHNQTIPPLTADLQESYRFLRYMAIVLNQWYTSALDYPDEGTSVYQPLLKSGEIVVGFVGLNAASIPTYIDVSMLHAACSSHLKHTHNPAAMACDVRIVHTYIHLIPVAMCSNT